MTHPSPLAIVIPAFRTRYLSATLASLAAQTCREFRVYVADDASPEPIAETVAPFAAVLGLRYHRFAENLGGRSLARHWARAIALSDEPHVWLFSDDDLAGPTCVEALLADLRLAPRSLALRRFDLEFVGSDGVVMATEPEFPGHLSGPGYAHHLLAAGAETCVVQNIVFPRARYREEGGFTDFPGGFCSDFATWPRLARRDGVRRLAGARVRFRRHDQSLSVAQMHGLGDRRPLMGCFGASLRVLRECAAGVPAGTTELRRAEIDWYCRWFRYFPRELTGAERAFALAEMRALWPGVPVARRWSFEMNLFATRLRRSPLGRSLLQARRALAAFRR